MKPKIYPVLEMCINAGVNLGYNRAFKHNPDPTQDDIKTCINEAITNEIYEWFDFEDEEE